MLRSKDGNGINIIERAEKMKKQKFNGLKLVVCLVTFVQSIAVLSGRLSGVALTADNRITTRNIGHIQKHWSIQLSKALVSIWRKSMCLKIMLLH